MLAILSLVIPALLPLGFVVASPTTLDADTLLKNGEQAQQLNMNYKSIRATDTCKGDDQACVEGSISKCVNGTWSSSQEAKCTSKGQGCFAVPSVRSPGVNLVCTSEKNAQSIIAACGVSSSTNNTTSGSGSSQPEGIPTSTQVPGSTGDAGTTAPDVTSPTASGGSPSVVTVFVTVTQSADAACQPTVPTTITSTLPPTTQTLSPDQASSILSSLTASSDTLFSVSFGTSSSDSSLATPTLPPALPVTSSAPSDESTSIPTFGADTPSTTILLTAAPESAAGNPVAVVYSTATPAAGVSVANNGDSSSSGSGYY